MKRVSRPISACAAMLLAICFSALAQAQVLDQIPSDALLVLRLKNLNDINEKAGALAKQMGFVEMTPAAADPLGSALGAIGFNAGVDKGSDAAIVLANGNLDADPPSILMLVPVTDYKAFLGNFADVKKDGELDVFKMSPNGQPEKEDTFAVNWGKYAVLTPVKELLAKKPDGFKVSGETAKEVASKDAVVIANFKVLGPMLTGKLKDNKDKIMGELDQMIAKEEKLAKYGPLIKAAVTQGLVIANEFLADTNAASFSINLSKEGIATSLMADFLPDSVFGKLAGSMKPATASLTAGLPDGKYIMFGGGVKGGDAGQKQFEEWIAPIEAELAKAGDEVKPALTLIQTFKKMTSAEKGQTIGLFAPTGAFMASPLLQSVTVTTGDSKTLIEGMLKMLEAQQDLMKLVPNQPASTFTITPDAKTVDGVSFTKFVNDITGTDAASQQAKQAFAMIYGPGGAVGYTGAVDDQHVLTVAGLDDATISAAIKAVKENNDPFAKSEPVNLVSKNLPQNRVAAMYLDLGQLITTGTNYAKMMGMAIPVNIKPDLAPLGFAIATEGSALRGDSFIPADLVEQMVTTVLQFKMMGAGGRGKPGGL